MPSLSKTVCCADRSILALLSAYQDYLATFKLMTSQVAQKARPLRACTCAVGSQRGTVLHLTYFSPGEERRYECLDHVVRQNTTREFDNPQNTDR